MVYHHTLVIGGGLAGLRAAIELNQHNVPVALLSKVHPLRSHSGAAQGGINAALGNHPRGQHDSPLKHAHDTIKGSDYLADQDAAVRMTQDAPERVYELEHWGCPFSRTPEGKIAQRPFGGAGFPRTCFAADKTGHAILHTLYQQFVRFKQSAERGETKLYDEWVVVELALEGDECRGVIAMNMSDGRLEAFQAEAVIFATGGSGRIYGNTTNAFISTGLGVAIPYWAGLPLKDMEFIQFHPTTLLGTNILMTEGCRGEGGYLLNNKGERFLANYDDSRKLMEVAPRDIVTRNITREIMAGRGFENSYVQLDIRHLGAERIMARLPGIRELCMDFAGVDPVLEPIPIQPGHHYTMGGIDTSSVGATAAKGFYAAGECACVSVHGANRLGGNSLLETVVFGKIAGEAAAEYVLGKAATGQGRQTLEDALKRAEERINLLRSASGTELPADIKEQLGKVMAEKVGIFRDAAGLRAALAEVKQLQERFGRIKLSHSGRKFNFDLLWALELKGNLDVAEAIAGGALAREESRGSHFRTDFPKRDDAAWLKHTVAQYSPEGVRLSYRPVTLGVLEPRERKY